MVLIRGILSDRLPVSLFWCFNANAVLAACLRSCELASVAVLLLYCDAVAPLLLAPQLGSSFAYEVSYVWRVAALLGACATHAC